MWWILLVIAVLALVFVFYGALASAASEADRITERINEALRREAKTEESHGEW
ncbi:MAG: hypothetical protein ACI4C1_10755 [Lachnospiraceae bacterium]